MKTFTNLENFTRWLKTSYKAPDIMAINDVEYFMEFYDEHGRELSYLSMETHNGLSLGLFIETDNRYSETRFSDVVIEEFTTTRKNEA